MKKLALHWKILIGMALGVLFGLLLSFVPQGSYFISNYIKPFGTIFINLLKLIAALDQKELENFKKIFSPKEITCDRF